MKIRVRKIKSMKMCENHVAVQMSLCSQCVRKEKEKAAKFVA